VASRPLRVNPTGRTVAPRIDDYIELQTILRHKNIGLQTDHEIHATDTTTDVELVFPGMCIPCGLFGLVKVHNDRPDASKQAHGIRTRNRRLGGEEKYGTFRVTRKEKEEGKTMKIAVCGGTGFVGTALVKHLLSMKADVAVVTRAIPDRNRRIPGVEYVTWEQWTRHPEPMEGAEAIVNLAGESIDQRWTEAAKTRILQSRLQAAEQVGALVRRLKAKPRAVINASGISIYGTSLTDTYDEDSPGRRTDFLSGVVDEWEKAIDRIDAPRVVKLRVGLVLGNEGGAFPRMCLPYRLGVGGRIGSGKQWFSWIHINDMVRLITYCIEQSDLRGPINATAPNPVTNDEFGRALGKAMRRPHYFPVPGRVLKFVFGELSVLLLEGQRVLPKRLLEHGFRFQYPTIDRALEHLVGRKTSG
jgi:hypothetical protein